jgi:hypothetical protein
MHTKFWSQNLKGEGHAEVLGVDGRIILKWIFREIGYVNCGLDHSDPAYGPVTGPCEYGNEQLGSIKGGLAE